MTSLWIAVCALALVQALLVSASNTSQVVKDKKNSGIVDVDVVGGENNFVDSADENNLNSAHVGYSRRGNSGGNVGGGGGGIRWPKPWSHKNSPTSQSVESDDNSGIETIDATGGNNNRVKSRDHNDLNSPHYGHGGQVSPRSFLSLAEGGDRNPTDQAVNDNNNYGILDADVVGGTSNSVDSEDENNLNSPHGGGRHPLNFYAYYEGPTVLPIPQGWRLSGTWNPSRQKINSNNNHGIEDIGALGGHGNREVSRDSNNLNSPHSFIGEGVVVDPTVTVTVAPTVSLEGRPYLGHHGGHRKKVISDFEDIRNSPFFGHHGGSDFDSGFWVGGGSGGTRSFIGDDEVGDSTESKTVDPTVNVKRLPGPRPWPRPVPQGNNPTSQVVNSNNNSGIEDVGATGGEGNVVICEDNNNLNSPQSGHRGGRRSGGGLRDDYWLGGGGTRSFIGEGLVAKPTVTPTVAPTVNGKSYKVV